MICLLGPTASGKSSLGLALLERFPLEIISMDSAQIYRGMDIGTAKPDAETLAAIPHHLVDICDPAESYSAARFAHEANELVQDILSRGRIPLLLGGTFLYMRALVDGLHDMLAADPQIRAEIEEAAARDGWAAQHQRLSALDSVAAEKIHPNDAQRIQRALELALQGQTRSAAHAQQRQAVFAGRVLKLAIQPDSREHLRELIAQRFMEMMDQGFLDEVRALHARDDLHSGLPSMRSVGYRQLWQHLDGELSLDEAIERGVISTRQYAKRQMTWLRSEKDLLWLSGSSAQRLKQAEVAIESFLQA